VEFRVTIRSCRGCQTYLRIKPACLSRTLQTFGIETD
jgi:hypothetical protein